MRKVLFLPGAGGSAQFWEPVARRLPDDWDKVLLGWPGLGDQPHDPAVTNIDDLVRLVEARIDGPVDLVAQSMGGVIAARIALARPQFVRRLVLVVTSAGLDMARFGASDWRDDYRRSFPNAADWILLKSAAPQLPIEDISVPTLLIWGGVDPISPVAVGRHLEARMPDATLHVLADGDHELAWSKPDVVAALVAGHLER
jgi:pimeloyl-ACP methyl ester carboxylesterase